MSQRRPRFVPPAFCCPWTGELMLNPVVTADGYTFERGPIEDWLRESRTNPCTGTPLPSRDVRPNLALRSSLDDWLRANRLTEEGVRAMLRELRGARGPEPQPTAPDDAAGSVPPRPPAPPPPLPLPANPWDEAVATAARTLNRVFGVAPPAPLAALQPSQQQQPSSADALTAGATCAQAGASRVAIPAAIVPEPRARAARQKGRTAAGHQADEGPPARAEGRRTGALRVAFLLGAVVATVGLTALSVSSPLGLAVLAGSRHRGLTEVVLRARGGAGLRDAAAWPSLDGRSALHYAVDLGWGAAARSLMEAGADPHGANTRTTTPPLPSAAAAGRAALVEDLLWAGAHPDAIDSAGRSALEYAVEGGDVRSVRALLGAGAQPKGTNPRRPAPLLAAILTGEDEIAELLLTGGADPNARGLRDSVLLTAVSAGSERAVRALLAAGADPHAANPAGEEALYRAVAFGHAGITSALLERGVDANLVYTYYSMRSPLHIAAQNGRADVVRLLVEAGVAHSADESGRTPMHLAAAKGQAYVIGQLAAAYCGVVDAVDEGLRTPLMVAAARRADAAQAGAVQALIAAGANVKLRDATQQTALGWALRWDASLEAVEALLKAGADTEARDSYGMTPARWAVAANNSAALRVLLPYRPKGAEPLGQDAGPFLTRAVEAGDLDLAQGLVDAGAGTEAADEEGLRPLHLAALAGDVRAVGLLLGAGAAHAAADQEGWTPAHYAANAGSHGSVLLLMRAGANMRARTLDGQTPPELAGAPFNGAMHGLVSYLRAVNGAGQSARWAEAELEWGVREVLGDGNEAGWGWLLAGEGGEGGAWGGARGAGATQAGGSVEAGGSR
ncbi:hypothetical protein HYH03_012561 [Edaphochlamys debaryana]|uniref:U-box domain-containing protein n=1 Tax=Edaphochlamys debaryana TaxID=47281 RepID=A0A835XPY1_9CHLO|nr:hypothetical protein HYH03_012561 [Edaphochlamys debaryana]|eukprot:KAG2488942.1 hypothetical protein HYH03_012561 [Edaphochlamys debaryana]